MLKKHMADFCMPQDQAMCREQLKLVYETKPTQTSPVQMTLHLTTPDSTNPTDSSSSSSSSSPSTFGLKFKTTAYAFCNPCNDVFEFIVCTHTSQQIRPPPPPLPPTTTQPEPTTTTTYSGQPMSLIDPNSQYTAATSSYMSHPSMYGTTSVPTNNSSVEAAAAAAAAAAAYHQMSMTSSSGGTGLPQQSHLIQQQHIHHHDGSSPNTGSSASSSSYAVGNYLMMSSKFEVLNE